MSINSSDSEPGRISPLIVLKGIVFSYLVTMPVFAVFSLILSRIDFPEKFISPAVLITTILSVFIAGVLTSVSLKNRGWLNGSAVGLLYMMILYLLSSITFGDFAVNRYVLTMVLIGVIAGAIGGITGINLKRPKYGRIQHK